VLCVAATLAGCGATTNLNKLWGKDDDAGDSLYLDAKAAYDRGDFTHAQELAQKLVDRNPDNEKGAVLLGYVYLSEGGIDPYELARKLVAMSSTSTNTASTNTDGTNTPTGGQTLAGGRGPGGGGRNNDGGAANDGASAGSQSTGTSASTTEVLQKLSSIVDVSDYMSVLAPTTFSKDDNGGVQPQLFAQDTNPLPVPAKVSDDLRSKVPVLAAMSKAIAAVCPFVDDSVKNPEDDPRHNCTPSPGPHNDAAKAHFLWAFSHLSEALVYQTVLLYSSSSDGTTNFQKASNELNTFTATSEAQFQTFVSDIGEMKNAVNKVFDVSSSDSMVHRTIANMKIVSLAFGEIAGLPDSIKSQVTNALSSLDQLSQSIGGVDSDAKAFKTQMTESLAKTVGSKIDTTITTKFGSGKTNSQIQSDPAISDETKQQVTAMCSSYDKLVVDMPQDEQTQNKPKACS